MKIFKHLPLKGNQLISERVLTADSFLTRLFGLIFMEPLKKGEALLIKGCRSIHTVGMKYSIDAVFIDRKGEIIAIFRGIPPGRFLPFLRKANAVIEFRGGFIKEVSLREGDRIIFE
jgi:uncharacterized membrane protein (UPF0127 family)